MGYNQHSIKGNVYLKRDGYVVGITANTQKEFFIDEEDYNIVKHFTWSEKLDGGFIVSKGKNSGGYLHRLIMGCTSPTQMVDHINHNRADNRKSNLRIVTNSQNQMNRTHTSSRTSGVRGVYWHKTKNKWTASIQKDGKLHHLGLFDNKDDAIKARKEAQKKYFGEFNHNEV